MKNKNYFKIIDIAADTGIECFGDSELSILKILLEGFYFTAFDEIIDLKTLEVLREEKFPLNSLDSAVITLLEEAIFHLNHKREILSIKKYIKKSCTLDLNIYKNKNLINTEIKALTRHNFTIRKDGNKCYYARVIFDL